jgi:predicted thioesterase
MSYIIIDPTKHQHAAATAADVERIIAELKKTFGANFKFKIRAVEKQDAAGAALTERKCIVDS